MPQPWRKCGQVAVPLQSAAWAVSHLQIPTPDLADEQTVRIYYGTRDAYNRTSTTFVEVEAAAPLRVTHCATQPVLEPGPLGAFDDSGAMPSCVVSHAGRKYLYYIGWNTSTTVRYRLAIGLAVSDDGGRSFHRLFDGPVFDRSPHEPYFVTTPFVRIEDGLWRMWYCGGTHWAMIDGLTEPRYQIKYATSPDGIQWTPAAVPAIDYLFEDEANTRPWVLRHNGRYRMWYCYRRTTGYRSQGEGSYRLGYAESTDGVQWQRRDEQVGLEHSLQGWDSEMMAYPSILEIRGRKHLFYNGNGFGQTGFGCAVLEAGE